VFEEDVQRLLNMSTLWAERNARNLLNIAVIPAIMVLVVYIRIRI